MPSLDRTDLERMESALRASPQSPESWLVYADWLIEQGDHRGELIVREHQMKEPTLSELERDTLRAEVSAIAEAHRKEWLPGWTYPEGCQLSWRHGFVLSAICNGDRAAEALCGLLPQRTARFLTTLELWACTEQSVLPLVRILPDSGVCALQVDSTGLDFEAIAACDGLRAITHLGFDYLNHKQLLALTRSTALRSVVSLRIHQQVEAVGAKELASCRALRGLRVLDLSSNNVGDAGASALAESGVLRSLEHLYLPRNDIGDAGARAMARSAVVRGLLALDVSHNRISAEGYRALAGLPLLRDTPLAGGGRTRP